MTFTTGNKIRAIVAALGLLAAFTAQADSESIGLVIAAQGDVAAANDAGVLRALKRKSPIYIGDTLKTGASSQAQIRFTDGEIIALRANSQLKVAEYRYKADPSGDKTVLSLIEGGVRAMTGAIGKNNPAAYRMDTPVATIGIRGTIYEAVVGSGLAVAVWQGGISVKNESGTVNLGINSEYNFARVDSTQHPPQPLLSPPKELQQDALPIEKHQEREQDGEGAREHEGEGEHQREGERGSERQRDQDGEPRQGHAQDQNGSPDKPAAPKPPGENFAQQNDDDNSWEHRSADPIRDRGPGPQQQFNDFAPMDDGQFNPDHGMNEGPMAPYSPMPLLPPPNNAPPPGQIITEQNQIVQIPQTPKLTAEEGQAVDSSNRVGLLVVVDAKTADLLTGKATGGQHGEPIIVDIVRDPNQIHYRNGAERSILRRGEATNEPILTKDADIQTQGEWGHWNSASGAWTRQVDTAAGTSKTNLMPMDAYWMTVAPTANPTTLKATMIYGHNAILAGSGSSGTIATGSLTATLNLTTLQVSQGALDIYVGIAVDQAGNPTEPLANGEHWSVALTGVVRGHVVDFNVVTGASTITAPNGAVSSGVTGDVLGLLSGAHGESLAGVFTLHSSADPMRFVDGIYLSECVAAVVCDKRLLDTEKDTISAKGGAIVFNQSGNASAQSGRVVGPSDDPVFLTKDPTVMGNNISIADVYRSGDATTTHGASDLAGIDWGYWDTTTGDITAQTDAIRPSTINAISNDAIWMTGTPTPNAALPKLGTLTYSDVHIAEGFGSGGNVTAMGLTADIDFVSGNISKGDLSLTVQNAQSQTEQWQAAFSGQVSNGGVQLDLGNGTINGNGQITGQLDAQLLGPTASVLGGSYHLENLQDSNQYVNGIFAAKCGGCP